MEKVIEPYICINHGEKTPCRWCSNSKLGTNKFDVPEVIGQSSIKEVHDNMESKPPVFGPANMPVDLDAIYPGLTNELDQPKTDGRFEVLGQKIGAMVDIKNIKYGNSFAESHKILAILYPNGISIEQMPDALAIIRIIDKLFRIATDRDALGESPYRDIAGYGILGAYRVEKNGPSST